VARRTLVAAVAAAGLLVAPGRTFVAVLGAGGRTGLECVEALRKKGEKVKALTRSGKWKPPAGRSEKGVETGVADVTSYSSVKKALAGATAVIWAAAFSRGKTTPAEVDNAGLVNTARAVKELGIERLVVVSSAATTRPYAPVGALLNLIGNGVLLEKEKGEKAMQGILDGTDSTWTILKPGGLKSDAGGGSMLLEFNQGDTIVGSIPRADVALVAATAATDPENRGAGKTFELYQAKGKSGLLPWYPTKSRYAVKGTSDVGAMLGRLLVDSEVTEVPGILPF